MNNKTELKDIFLDNDYNNFNNKNNNNNNNIDNLKNDPYYYEFDNANANANSNANPNENLNNIKKKNLQSTNSIGDYTDTFELMNKEMQSNDFFMRLIAINLSIEEDKAFDIDTNFSKNTKGYLPWEDEVYEGKSKFNTYTSDDIPDWLKILKKSIYYNKNKYKIIYFIFISFIYLLRFPWFR
jgi:hypothetical protein